MFTDSPNQESAWIRFLGREFKGLNQQVFEDHFKSIADSELREKALNSLKKSGPD